MNSLNEQSDFGLHSLQQLPSLLRQRLLLSGHRNWIVVADAAYPHHANKAIETLSVTADITGALDHLLPAIDSYSHIRPSICLDQELQVLRDVDVAGVTAFQADLLQRLEKYPRRFLLHEELLRRIDAAASVYRIVVIKTSTLIPYSSVFIELQCGYWNEDAEARLRWRLQPAKPGSK
jgi:hypothetical protein